MAPRRIGGIDVVLAGNKASAEASTEGLLATAIGRRVSAFQDFKKDKYLKYFDN